MKTTSALALIVLVGFLGWALPAGAEKAPLTDAQLDEITAGVKMMPPTFAQLSLLLRLPGVQPVANVPPVAPVRSVPPVGQMGMGMAGMPSGSPFIFIFMPR